MEQADNTGKAPAQATKCTFDEDTVSDLHKDAYNFRPSAAWYGQWRSMTDDEKQLEWDRLIEAMEQSTAEEKIRQEQAVASFQALVETTIASGAEDVETAHRWLMEASSCDGDWEYFCHCNGLPYSYFKEQANNANASNASSASKMRP